MTEDNLEDVIALNVAAPQEEMVALFYAKLGFVDTGRVHDGEIEALSALT